MKPHPSLCLFCRNWNYFWKNLQIIWSCVLQTHQCATRRTWWWSAVRSTSSWASSVKWQPTPATSSSCGCSTIRARTTKWPRTGSATETSPARSATRSSRSATTERCSAGAATTSDASWNLASSKWCLRVSATSPLSLNFAQLSLCKIVFSADEKLRSADY